MVIDVSTCINRIIMKIVSIGYHQQPVSNNSILSRVIVKIKQPPDLQGSLLVFSDWMRGMMYPHTHNSFIREDQILHIQFISYLHFGHFVQGIPAVCFATRDVYCSSCCCCCCCYLPYMTRYFHLLFLSSSLCIRISFHFIYYCCCCCCCCIASFHRYILMLLLLVLLVFVYLFSEWARVCVSVCGYVYKFVVVLFSSINFYICVFVFRVFRIFKNSFVKRRRRRSSSRRREKHNNIT